MVDQGNYSQQGDELVVGLRQALLRLTSPQYDSLREEIESLQRQIDTLSALQKSLESLEAQLDQSRTNLNQLDKDLMDLIQETRKELSETIADLTSEDETTRKQIVTQVEVLDGRIDELDHELEDPRDVTRRIQPVLLPIISERARSEQAEFARAVAPVMGPAIRHQIRESRQDVIDSLYPIIGQIISKSISESIRELTRNIDARMRRQLDFGSRMRHWSGRLRGVSEAEMVLRDSLPYKVHHIFLIHHSTGILLEHLNSSDEQVGDADIVTSMLTAIRDFVSDSFGGEVGELEEITHGDRRFLITSGMYAYLAVVLEGIEPSGFHSLITESTNEINLTFESELQKFNGELDNLPGFTEKLEPFFEPEQALIDRESAHEPMSKSQKWAIFGILAGIMLLLGLIIFACVFTIRLWPYAFP